MSMRAEFQRPNPLRWLWYAWGGRLPDRHREWVLYDLTCYTWVVRHFARAATQHSVWLLLLLLPIPWQLRVYMAGLAVFVGMMFSAMFIEDASERRVVQHGYPEWLARRIREEAAPRDRADVAALYATWYRGEAPSDVDHGKPRKHHRH